MCSLEKRGPVYLLTLTGTNSEHRLNPPLLNSILSTLSQIQSDYINIQSCSCALVIAAEGKFFCNGFDFSWVQADLTSRLPLVSSLLQQTIAALISLPMPTVAAITGHAAAAGVMLALSCDYVIMRSDRGLMYMSETDIGLRIPDYFVSLIGTRVKGRGMRDLVLGSKKVNAKGGLEIGILDKAVEGVEGTVNAAVEMGMELVKRGWNGEVYKVNRLVTMKEVCREVGVNTGILAKI